VKKNEKKILIKKWINWKKERECTERGGLSGRS